MTRPTSEGLQFHYISDILNSEATNFLFLVRYVALFLIVGVFCGPAQAQDFFIEQSTPAHGDASVSHSDTVSFSFNRQVAISTDWNTEFVYEPSGALTFDEVSLCLTALRVCDSGDDIPRHVRFQVEHQANTDYTWLVYAVQTVEGTSMTRPYVLRYTTASELGQGQVTGSAAAPEQAGPPSRSVRASLRKLVEGLKRSDRGRPVFDPADSSSARRVNPSDASDRPSARLTTVGSKNVSSGPFTQILLVDEFSIDESAWTVRSADALIGSSGTYSLDFVRSGSYVPIAVRYTDGTNTDIDALGFYDPEADGTPNAVEVNGDQQTGIDLQLYDFPLTTARAPDRLSVAVDSAAAYAADQELRWVQAGSGIRPSGTAYEWTYYFYSPSTGLETEVTIDPLEVTVDTTADSGVVSEMNPMPDGFVDSDEALHMALDDGGQAFVDSFQASNVSTVLEGGNLYWTDAPIPSEEFWHVRLFGETSTSVDVFERYINIETGEFLPVEMTRFTASVDGSAVLLRWKTASETNNAGFEVQHAAGDSAAADWKNLGFVEGAGTTQQPQTYRFRTESLAPGRHHFRLRQVDTDGTPHLSTAVRVVVQMDAPLRLTPPTPHPVQKTATLHFGTREATAVTLALYDMLGRRVATLYEGPAPEGRMHPVRIHADQLPSGVYFLRLRAGDRTKVRRLTLVE